MFPSQTYLGNDWIFEFTAREGNREEEAEIFSETLFISTECQAKTFAGIIQRLWEEFGY